MEKEYNFSGDFDTKTLEAPDFESELSNTRE
jgi:hypothetical protein